MANRPELKYEEVDGDVRDQIALENKSPLIIICQRIGRPFVRIILGKRQEREVVVLEYLDEASGQSEYSDSRNHGGVFPTDFPTRPIDSDLPDPSEVGNNTLEKRKKRRSSRPRIKVGEKWEKDGGDPDYRPEKKGGFFLPVSAKEVEEVRKKGEGDV